MVWVVTAAPWDAEVPGMATVRNIASAAERDTGDGMPLHYMRDV
jgi:hypothetical protein